MQRLVFFLLMATVCFGTLSAQDYFDGLRDVRESIDSLIEYIENTEPNSVEEPVFMELQGAQNRLGAARSELYILALMGWLLDLGRQHDMLDDEDFALFEQDFMQTFRHVFTGEMRHNTFDRWVRNNTAALFAEPILDMDYTRFTTTLNALNQNALITDPGAQVRVALFPEDIEAFFDSYCQQHTRLERGCPFLVRAVARSLFNLAPELVFSAAQNPSVLHVYVLLMEVVRSLYALIGAEPPSLDTIRLSPRTLAELAPSDNEESQQRTPRRGSLSPRENFNLPPSEPVLPGRVILDGTFYGHHRVASTGHSF